MGACCLVGSNPIQSLLMLFANTGEPKRKALVTEGCGVEFSFTVSWHRLEVLRRSQFLGSSVVVA